MYFYQAIFDDFVPPIDTSNFDIFLPNVKKIQPTNFIEQLTNLGYLRSDDCVTARTVFYSQDGFKIEFLTSPDRNMSKVIWIHSIGIGAKTLQNMQPITWNYVTLSYKDYKINVPSPASYCLQKLLINKDRDELKRAKDIEAVRYVLGYVSLSQKYRDEFINSLNNAPKKWQKIIKETMEINNLSTFFK